MPVNPFLGFVAPDTPGSKRRIQGQQAGDAPLSQALSGHRGQLYLRDVQPTAMYGRVVNLRPLRKTESLFGRKGFIQRGKGMGVQVVHDQHDFFRVRVLFLQREARGCQA